MADNTPVVTESVAPSAPIAEPQLEATKKEVEIPEFAKGLEATKEEVVEEKPAAPVPQEEEADQKKQLSAAISKVEQKNEEVRQHVALQADFVRENNELIHKIAASNPQLANQVVEKVWGVQGIRSYKQLLERSKLEDLKGTDPDAYETKRKLWEVENRLEAAEKKEQKTLKGKFLKEKGILENEYDPNYRKFNEAFESLNPTLVSEDYDKAMAYAYAISRGESKPVPVTVEVPTLQVGGGNKPAPLPSAVPQVSSQSAWLADTLNKKLGYKISLTT